MGMTEGRALRLQAFLEEVGCGPVRWGVDDCSAAPVAWLNRESGLNIRLPRYDSREAAHEIIAKHGDLAGVWDAIGITHQLSTRYGEPELGDVAVIETRRFGQIGGILGAGRVLMLRKDCGGWHAFGPVRSFVKVFQAP